MSKSVVAKNTTKNIKQVSHPVKTETPSIISSKKTKVTPTCETIIGAFDELIEIVNEEIIRLRKSSIKTKGAKFLRSVNKRVKTLRGQTIRIMKQKKKNTGKIKNTNSGFLKPVKISKDLAKFTGWDEDLPRSRVDVTKYICNYIADNKLQNPKDRRQIQPDIKLQKLLGFNPKNEKKPLKYCSIQTQLKSQNHFPKD